MSNLKKSILDLNPVVKSRASIYETCSLEIEKNIKVRKGVFYKTQSSVIKGQGEAANQS